MNEIRLESSLLGFCSLNDDIVLLRNLGVLLRNDEDYVRHSDRVMLISGGGAGHEPGPANGFIGRGMLSAAVSGNVFTSPSVTSCLAAILQANDVNREILLIINNYTGDRLNFGLAVEMARNIHNYRHVKLLIVDDDCSIDNPRESTGRRGLAGINLISKIAGAMSAQGACLNEIYEMCSTNLLLNRLIRTIGFCFRHESSNVLTAIEIGYGIHGEPGAMIIEKAGSFKPVIDILKEKLRLNEVKADAVLLFNNLGGASEYIFNVFVKEFMELVEGLPIRVVKIYAGKFLTSLSKEAISVTVLEVHDPRILEYLEMPIRTPAGDLFNSPFKLCKPLVRDFRVPQKAFEKRCDSEVAEEEGAIARKIIAKSCEAAIAMKNYLNEIDSELGDGDTGSTLSRGAEALLRDLKNEKINVRDPHSMLLQISSTLMDSMGGTSGAIFSIFFQCASSSFSDFNEYSVKNWTNSLSVGIEGIMKHGKSKLGDRTLLDSLQAGYERMKGLETSSADEAFRAFAKGCTSGCESTKTLRPKSGRSAYSLSDKDSDFTFKSDSPDPGAHAISVLANAIAEAFLEIKSTRE